MYRAGWTRWQVFGGALVTMLGACRSTQTSRDVPVLDAAIEEQRPADLQRPAPESSREGTRPPFRCVEDWPAFTAAQLEPSLSVKAPVELWRKSLPDGNFIPETAFTGTHLGILTRNQIWILDLQGNVTGHLQDADSHFAGGGPVADRDGNFYFVTSRAIKILPDGTVSWSADLGPNLSPSLETTASSRLLLSPDGILYFAASDGYLYGLMTKGTSRQKWKVNVGLGVNKYALNVRAGVGDTILMEGSNRVTTDGTTASVPVVGGQPMEVLSAVPDGMVGGFEDSEGFRTHVLDRCGKLLWAFPKTGKQTWWITLLDYDSRYLVTAGAYPTAHLYFFSRDGTQLLGPKDAPVGPRLLGADGTLLETRCTESGGNAVLDLFAYSAALDPSWSLSFAGPCHLTSLALGDDGVLYVTRANDTETEVIAIQTAIPGLGRTALPIAGYNNRRTGWLAPE
jgi:hypothetical protein